MSNSSSAEHLRLLGPLSNLEPPRARLHGRRDALAELQRWLDETPPPRLRVLCGAPGVGKTRLALALLAHALEIGRARWAACWFVDLGAARDAHALVDTVAGAIGATLPRFASLEAARNAVLAHLRAPGRTLLVLDNLEQLDDAAIAELSDWPRSCETLTLLGTTRRAEPFAAIHRQPLEPLRLPEAERRGPGWHLFVERARAVLGNAAYTPDADESRAIRDIVAAVDALPLAIELAAARLLVLSPVQLAERLRRRLDVLVDPIASARGQDARASLAAVLETSWALLDDEARRALAACSVFHGPFTPDAAEHVLGPPRALDAVHTLVAASLLEVERGSHNRLRMLAPIREFAATRRDELEVEPAASARHRRYFATRASRLLDALTTSSGRRELDALLALRTELEGIVAGAVARADDHAALDDALACGLGLEALTRRSVVVTAPLALLEQLLERIAAHADTVDPERHVRLLCGLWRVTRVRGTALACERLVDRAVAIAERDARPQLLARALHGRAVHLWSRGERGEALASCAGAVAAARRSGDAVLEAQIAVVEAWLLHDEGELERALRGAEAGLERLEECGAHHEWCLTAANLAVLTYQSGALDATLELQRRVLPRCLALGDVHLEARVVNGMCGIESLLDLPDFDGHHERALELARGLADRELEVAALLRAAWHHVFAAGDAARHEEALELMARALATHRGGGNLRMLAYTLQSSAELYLVLDDASRAAAAVEEASRIAQSSRNHAQHAVLLSMAAACERRDWHRARELVVQARALATGNRDEKLALGIELESVYVDARHGVLANDPARFDDPATAAALAILERVLRPSPPPLGLAGPRRPYWRRARYMRAATRRVLASLPPRLAAEAWARALDPEARALVDGGDGGATMRLPGGEWLDLASTPTPARVFGALLAARRAHGTQARVDFDTCIAAGWPEERILPEAALNRLHQIVSRLRRRGLRDLIENVDGGYRIAPATAVVGPERV